uniref:HXXXD-type acyl-transferase family protein n=1 Tax=Kalanchoe fedtschenkoi TaxID=63787 RepID=A0A7N0V769_KALFE
MERSVQVISVTFIRPATYRPDAVPRRIDLTPWDLQFLLTGPIPRGLVFSSNLAPSVVHRLQESLSQTLDFFYPLAGRLASIQDSSGDSTLFYVECNNAGVEFTHAVADGVTVADLLQPKYDQAVKSLLFPQRGLVNIECSSKPFLAVQATELANGGGFFLGCSLSHLFADGVAFWNFINSWSAICRGCDSLTNPPVLHRCYPCHTEIWIPNQLFAHYNPPSDEEQTGACEEKIFNFPKEKIASLKQKAIAETGNQKISSLQALLAFVCKLVSRHRQVQPDDVVFVSMPSGDRTRTEPPMSAYYLGNAVRSAAVTMSGAELEGSLGSVAVRLHGLVASQTSATVNDFLKSWIEKPAILRIGSGGMKNGAILIGGSRRCDVYGNDFGWGRMGVFEEVRSGVRRLIDGRMGVFEGAEDGSIHMEFCLSVETLERLEKDGEFLDFVRL